MIGVDACPVFNDRNNFLRSHIGEGDMMLGRESEDVADALDTLSLEE